MFSSLYGRVYASDRLIFLSGWLAMYSFGVIVDYNTMSLRPRSVMTVRETSNMKTQVYEQANAGLLVLIMLTIALIAGQSEPNIREQAPATNAFQLDAGLSVTIDRERRAKLESLSAVIETVLILPINADLNIDDSASPASDVPNSENSPVQYD